MPPSNADGGSRATSRESASAALCVAGVVTRGGRVLLVHRSPSARHYPDVWDLFGGHVNKGESLEEALHREAREELGIEVLALRWLGQTNDTAEPAVVHVYAVTSWEGEPFNAAPDEHTEVCWFGARELPQSDGLDAYRALIVEALG